MSRRQSPIAVVGLSALFPDAADVRSFWRNILAGRDSIVDVPASHWRVEDYYDPNPDAPDKTYARRGGFLPSIPFDPIAFGIPPNMIRSTDTAQLLALVVAKQVLDDAARGDFARLDPDRISVILGATGAQELMLELASRLQRPQWAQALRDLGYPEPEIAAACERMQSMYVPITESTFPGLLGNVIAGRIANRFNLGGTNCVTDAACASSLSALQMAVQELELGHSDLVIAGGVDTMNDVSMFMCFSKTPALSLTGDCRPFSADADGTMLGEGLGMLALKRLDDAERDGDRIYAVVRGVGCSSDGRALSVYAPLPEGQAKALRRAYAAAGFSPDTVELVEAHGTGTKAGDMAELTALARVYDETGRRDRQWCALGSVKSQIGHTKGAAGAAGLTKVVLALHHKVLPPTIKVSKPNLQLKLEESPLYLSTQARPWIRDTSHPRRAAVSAFGFGGSNFHVVLEEYAGPSERPARTWTSPSELVLLGGASGEVLATTCRELARTLADDDRLSAHARRSQRAFDASSPHRVAIVATDIADLRKKLDQAAQRLDQQPNRGHASPNGIYVGAGAREGSLAFLFPGQGSQYVGMGADLAMAFDAARASWDAVASVPLAETPLHEVVFPIPAFDDATRDAQSKRLTATEHAQPAIGATSLALLAVLRQVGAVPEQLGGHSFGELTALHAAGVIDASAFLHAARRRGELMRDASEQPGAMTAVGAPAAEVAALLEKAGVKASVANDNSPRQIVLSGDVAAIEHAERVLEEADIAAKRLPVATAFHSHVVAAARAPFRRFLDSVPLNVPTVPVLSNVSAARHGEPESIRELLAEQIVSRVRFVEMIEAMYASGVRTFLEVGPGHVLSNLVDQILGDRPANVINLDRKGQHGLTAFWHGLGRLSAAGYALDFGSLWAPYAEEELRPPAPPKFAISINGANYGRPYPAGDRAPGRNPPLQRPGPKPETAASPPPVADVGALSEAHATLQRALTEGHVAYLRAMESSFAAFCAASNGTTPTGFPTSVEARTNLSPVPSAAWGGAPVERSSPVSIPELRREAEARSSDKQSTSAPPQPGEGTGERFRDPSALLIAVVAEKTGYPAEMLNPSMSLEGDLGVDSIKRVEILSALSERLPGLPVIKPSDVATLRSLGDIAKHLSGLMPTAEPKAERPAHKPEQVLIEVIAEKTGYPPDMLNPAMSLEGDLGVDSIKRVEILSALSDRIPGLPTIKPSDVATLRTIGEIANHLSGSAAPVARQERQPPPAANLSSTVLAVVAEKTGYPVDLLQPSMSLEADLGIDSIKRVEILSALRDRHPSLPAVPQSELGSLRTLGQIIDRLGSGQPRAPAAAPTPHVNGVPKLTSIAPPLARSVVMEVGAVASGTSLFDGRTLNCIAVTDDGSGVASEIATRLRCAGLPAEHVMSVTPDADAVIHLGGLRPATTVTDALGLAREAFLVAMTAAARVSAGGVFVTVQDTGGDFGASGSAGVRSWLAGLPGLTKTAAHEWPSAAAKAIDIARGGRSPAEIADAIVNELFDGGSELEVGLHADGARTTLASIPSPVSVGDVPLRPGAVVIASGGARGVTVSTLEALVRQVPLRLAILGRTALVDEPACVRGITDDAGIKRALLADARARGENPSPAQLARDASRILAVRETRAGIATLKRAGAEVRYIVTDVRDSSAVNTAVSEIRRAWGPIAGVIHAAGVLADRNIADKTEEQLDLVLDTKLRGLSTLLDATRSDPLELLCFFSSVAARAGNAGQGDYALANETLNRVAAAEQARRGVGCVVRSIGWGPWEGGMVTPGLRSHFEARGVPLISLAAGAQAFVNEIRTGPHGPVEVLIGGALDGADRSHPLERVRVVTRSEMPFLDSHRVHGNVVLPVMVVLEWFKRTARELFPSLAVVSCEDLRVLKGAVLKRWDDVGERFIVRCTSVDIGAETVATFELIGEGGARHYRALVRLAELSRVQPAPELPRVPDEIPHESAGAAKAYSGALFHGPHFQALRALGQSSNEGIVGTLFGSRSLGWSEDAYATDPALLDGGLQLALLWGHERLGQRTLPTRIGAVRVYQPGLIDGPVRAVLRTDAHDPLHTSSTVAWIDESGRPIALMEGIEMHVISDDPAASREAA